MKHFVAVAVDLRLQSVAQGPAIIIFKTKRVKKKTIAIFHLLFCLLHQRIAIMSIEIDYNAQISSVCARAMIIIMMMLFQWTEAVINTPRNILIEKYNYILKRLNITLLRADMAVAKRGCSYTSPSDQQ